MGQLAPSVEKPRPRVRTGFLIVLAAVVAVGIAVPLALRFAKEDAPAVRNTSWVNDLRVHCTPLELKVYLQQQQLPTDQRAVCYAIAGDIDHARTELAKLPRDVFSPTIAMIFNIAHPIADAGDDRSAGPIMRLVVELWPENYMATFHAGMAAYALGDDAAAKTYLVRFIGMYGRGDVWTQRARAALAGLARNLPLAEREAHFPE